MQRTRAAFHHAVVIQHRLDGAEEALHIHPEAQMLHIIAVQPGFIGNFQLIPAVDLRPAGQTGSDIGRGPMTAISPTKMFHSCGSSSKLVLRRKCPIRVMY